MATWRATYFFEGQFPSAGLGRGRSYGWTESWYFNADNDIEVAIDIAISNYQYLDVRMALLASDYQCTWVRVSQVGNPLRNVKVKAPTIVSGRGAAADAAQVQCAVLFQFTAVATLTLPIVGAVQLSTRRSFLMRGLPADFIQGNVLAVGAAVRQALNLFGARITAPTPNSVGRSINPFLLRTNDFQTGPWITPANLVLEANGLNLDITPPAGGTFVPALGARVQTRRIGSPLRANRFWTVLSPTGALPIVLGTARRPMAGAWNNTGQVRLADFLYFRPTNYVIVGLTSKKVGRPFALPRGRARTRS